MNKTKRFTLLAMFITVEVLVAIVPFLGYIPLGVLNATTLHIPVIIAGILLGKKEGAIVGFVFGLTSMLKATFEPNATSFLFSPFVTIGNVSGNWQSLIIAFLPRILIGYTSGAIYEWLHNKKQKESLSLFISSLCGSLVNTILVLFMSYLFFGTAYANAINVPYQAIITFLLSIIATNGIAEAIVAIVITYTVCKAAKKTMHI